MAELYNKIVEMTDQITKNLNDLDDTRMQIQQVSDEIPILENYDEDSIEIYLLDEGYEFGGSDFEDFKQDILDVSKKRQGFYNTIEYLNILNATLQIILTYYKDNAILPNELVLEQKISSITAENIDNIQDAVDFIKENGWINND